MKTPIGQQLRRLREREGMTQAAVARLSGLTVRTVQNVEHQSFPPSLDTLSRLAAVFGKTVTLSSKRRDL